MTTFKNYLLYRLKNSVIKTLIFSFSSLIISIWGVNLCIKETSDYLYGSAETGIYILAIILGVFSTLIPMLETSEFKLRRNLDTLYFLPISRFKLALTHYISGFIQVFVIYTVSFIGAVTQILPHSEIFKTHYLLPYYLLSMVIGLIMYSFFIFIFGTANTVSDGVSDCIAWMFAIFIASLLAIDIFDNIFAIYFPKTSLAFLADISFWGIVYMPINNLTMIFQNMIEPRSDSFAKNVIEIMNYVEIFFVWAAIGIACVYGYFKTFIKKGAEKAEEISDSWFGAKLLIPLYMFTILKMSNGELGIWGFILVVIAFLTYALFRRSFKLKIKDIANLSVFAAMLIIDVNIFTCIIAPFIIFSVSLAKYLTAVIKNKKAPGTYAGKQIKMRFAALILTAALLITIWCLMLFG